MLSLLILLALAFLFGTIIGSSNSAPKEPTRSAEDLAHAAVSKSFVAARTSSQIAAWSARTALLASRNIGRAVKDAAREARQQDTQSETHVDDAIIVEPATPS